MRIETTLSKFSEFILLLTLSLIFWLGNGKATGAVLRPDSLRTITKETIALKDSITNDTTVISDSVGSTLQELVVTKELVEDDGMTKTYLITKDMLKKSYNTAQLIDNLPGMDVDFMTNTIKYLGRDKIKILVDSIEKDEDHVKRLNPKRFEKVEVTVMPTGRYAEYDVLINLKMKPDYTGSELQLFSMNVLSPAYLRKDKFALASDNLMFDYMKNQWNFYMDCRYAWVNAEGLSTTESHYLLENIVEKSLSNPKYPTNHGYQRQLKLSLNADYKLHPNHTVGAVYTLSTADDDSFGNMEYEHEDLVSGQKDYFTSNSINRLDNTAHLAGLFYEGRNIKGWSIGARSHFYIEKSFSDNLYKRSSGFEEHYITHPSMNYTFAGINVNKRFFDKLTLNIDYNYINRNRDILNDKEEILTRMRENRQYAGLGLDYSIGWKTYLSGGVFYLNDNVVSSGMKTLTSKLGFRLTARHTLNNKLNVMFRYFTDSEVPTSSQLSDYGQFVSPYLFRGGNPDLKTTMNHFLSADINFLGAFTLSGGYVLFNNEIGDFSEEYFGKLPDGSMGKYIMQRPVNYNYRSSDLKLSFYKNVGPVKLNAAITYINQ